MKGAGREVLAWLVKVIDYDWCRHVGYFVTEDEARACAAELEDAEDDGEVIIEECRVVPRRERPPAYVVEIDAAGNVAPGVGGAEDGWVMYTTPDAPGWNDGEAAHWWRSSDGRIGADWGTVIRAAGLTREEAIARALALLATSPDSAVENTEATP